MPRGAGGDGEATRARHSMAVTAYRWPAAPGMTITKGGAGQKSGGPSPPVPPPVPSPEFFLAFGIFGRLARDCRRRRAWEGQPIWRGLRQRDCPLRLPPGLASPILGLSQGGFAIGCVALLSGRIFYHFPNGFRQAIIYKGTVGTWEHTMSNRQNALRWEIESVFPSRRVVWGTWEQKSPIPAKENPRACGYPVPRPAGERA
jgi:hypothetical protein